MPRPLRGRLEEGLWLGKPLGGGGILDLVPSSTQKLPNGPEVPGIAAAVRVQPGWGPAGRQLS